ncbi:Hypothetical predicted protein [Xyrichtys novacula]|uniref:Uncharacterized protein n=1 Tax=Xyrichtys novacula TaxID=13765 RepID=A0AAV1HG38_XYRNO|nr:Hypothetical predicted protein [Xyrichtys novacula]
MTEESEDRHTTCCERDNLGERGLLSTLSAKGQPRIKLMRSVSSHTVRDTGTCEDIPQREPVSIPQRASAALPLRWRLQQSHGCGAEQLEKRSRKGVNAVARDQSDREKDERGNRFSCTGLPKAAASEAIVPKLASHWLGGAPQAPQAAQQLFIGLVRASSWSSTSDWFRSVGL